MKHWISTMFGFLHLLFCNAPAVCDSLPVFARPEEAEKWADQQLSVMSLEKKVAQLIFVDIAGGYISEQDPRLRGWVRLVREGVGGMVTYGGTPRDVASLLNRLQKEAPLPLLMAADFEGGPGQQVSGATEFPANMAFAAIGSEELMYRAARVGSREGRAMGFHLTYSPVVDLSTMPENPAESVRSFGGDVGLLGRLVKAYIKGYLDGGMLATAKHYPGRGNVSPWPKQPLFTMIDKSAAEMESEDLAAFRKAIEAGVPLIMTEHISVPALTNGSDLPASVERSLATGWLRERLGFRGILTTDDLWYEQVINRFGPLQVGVKALQAGHDLLLKPKDASAMIRGVTEAVRAGQVDEAHVNQAVRKLLTWKARLRLPSDRFVDESSIDATVGTKEHWNLAQEVADRSLTLLKDDGVLPISTMMLANAVNINIQKLESDPSPQLLSAKLRSAFPSIRDFTLRPDLDPVAYERVLAAAKTADWVILSLFVQRDRLGDAAPLRARDLSLIGQILEAKPKRVIAMSYGNPHLIRKMSAVPAFLVGYGERGWFGNQSIYFDSFIKWAKGEIKAEGRLPVHVSDEYRMGSGIRR
ncbi:MAG: glycoside hydrolase family 3 N-terminal domain-containing protein [Acidobacteriota bacterium]